MKNYYMNLAKPFTIEGVEYRTLKEASGKLGIPIKTIHDRLRSPLKIFSEYRYVKPKSTIQRPKW